MHTVAVIQARMGSTRLPGKVLRDIGGRPMVMHVIERARRIDGVDEAVAAIPDLPEDDVLARALADRAVRLVRGPADDVLERYRLAALDAGADAVVRVTADCPLLSPAVASRVVSRFAAGGCDYASNTRQRTYPRGMDVEVISREVLETAAREAVDPAEREHVTPFIWRRPERFHLCSVHGDVDHSDLRLTVDTEADLAVVRAVHDALGDAESQDLDRMVGFLSEHPELVIRNAHVTQREVVP